MVNDGGPPPLPETEDPYELLGVARDADPPTVKKAYAKLVRVYRPDKSPREFQRVHQAFEIVRARGSDVVPVIAPPVVIAPPTIDDGARETRISARVAAAESFEARCALIDELLAEKVPLDLVFAHEALRDAAVRHRALDWARLAEASSDLRAVHAVWGQIWRYAFEHDRERAAALLDDDRLRRDAADHPHLAIACIDRIAALNWLHAFDERRLVRLLREACPPGHPWVDHSLDAIELDFAGASAIRQRDWPAPLHAFVKLAIAHRIESQERCIELARELSASLTADPASTLAAFDALGQEISLEPFFEIIYEALPADYVRLDALAKERFARLTEVLAAAGASPQTWKIRGGVAAAAGALAVISWIPGAVLAGGALTYGLATEGIRYKRQIRPRLVQAILDVPVVSPIASRWITLNRKHAGRLIRYTPAIDNDNALFTFSMLVCYADVFCSSNRFDGDLPA
jgi:hypothetical protein